MSSKEQGQGAGAGASDQSSVISDPSAPQPPILVETSEHPSPEVEVDRPTTQPPNDLSTHSEIRNPKSEIRNPKDWLVSVITLLSGAAIIAHLTRYNGQTWIGEEYL